MFIFIVFIFTFFIIFIVFPLDFSLYGFSSCRLSFKSSRFWWRRCVPDHSGTPLDMVHPAESFFFLFFFCLMDLLFLTLGFGISVFQYYGVLTVLLSATSLSAPFLSLFVCLVFPFDTVSPFHQSQYFLCKGIFWHVIN